MSYPFWYSSRGDETRMIPNLAMAPIHGVRSRGSEATHESRESPFWERSLDTQDADRTDWRGDGEAEDDAL